MSCNIVQTGSYRQHFALRVGVLQMIYDSHI
jgi:hypothetical protein